MSNLHAVPDQPAEHLDVPADWPELRASFVLSLRAAQRSKSTIATYTDGLDLFATFLADIAPGRLVEQATRDDLRSFFVGLRDRGLSDNTIGTRHRALRALFKFMAAEDIIETDPMRQIPVVKITDEKVPQALTTEQIETIVKACAPARTFVGARDRALILLVSSSGIRASECLGLTEADLHLDSETPFVRVLGKGGAHREAAVSFEAARAVLAYLRLRRKHKAAHRPELWLSRAGHALSVSGLRQIVHDAGERAGIDGLYTHALRHSAVHAMLDRGMQEHDVMVQAGWTSTKQLQRYGRARAVERSRAAFFR
jgi:site-specific recombinase XerD